MPRFNHCSVRIKSIVLVRKTRPGYGERLQFDWLAHARARACVGGLQDELSRWHQAAIFYALRLMLAPAIESLLLLDRLLFLRESTTKNPIADLVPT